jgi:hypothetical protein
MSVPTSALSIAFSTALYCLSAPAPVPSPNSVAARIPSEVAVISLDSLTTALHSANGATRWVVIAFPIDTPTVPKSCSAVDGYNS